ncbi:AEC family transporter [Acinetobacter qingfengensis]|uniref:Permease n=1 Tax=Acinetobacter qingfengensis TaxID=1262585 RepID=A0A1E7QWH3_9GAMM|nr:AEC family transporter [Acinetobacter qingfengensis]KAA8731301.1 AEC family transporter [Acinetobacter qingfengensis]OEY91450.1 permease [Acinetobacter qingfengensis]
MLDLISMFTPPISLMLLGLYFKYKSFFNINFWEGAEKLNYYILFPALLFSSLANAKDDVAGIKSILIIIFIVMFVIIIFSYLLAIIKKVSEKQMGVYIQSLIRFNTYLGLSIALTLPDEQIRIILVSILAIAIPFVNVISILSLTSKHNLNLKNIFYSLIKNPLINSCLIGIGFNYFSIKIWIGFDNLLSILSTSSLMLGLLCVGAAINFDVIRKNFIRSLSISIVRLFLIPLFTILISSFFILNSASLIAIIIFFSIPTASSAYVLTKVLGGDHELMAGIISLQTLLCLISLPVIMYLIENFK